MSEKMSADPHAYLMWPRLIVNNICGALAIAATALISRSLVNFHHSQHALVGTNQPHMGNNLADGQFRLPQFQVQKQLNSP